MLTTFRDAIRTFVPWWLRNGTAGKLLYAIAIHFDALMDALVFGIYLRFPGLYTPESLPYLSRDRKIRRGKIESDATHAARLIRWLDYHPYRGGPHAMLGQIQAHFAPNSFPVEIVYFSGRRFSIDINGVVTKDDIGWAPDTEVAKWARWWLFYQLDSTFSDDGLWGDSGVWGDGGTWGSNLTSQQVTDYRIIPREWNAAHAIGKIVLMEPDAELWGYPPGTWGDPGIWGGGSTTTIGVG